MMRSIYLCNKKNSVESVYADSFDKLPEVERRVYTSAEVIASPETFKDVEYVFSTWGMPSMSDEEIKTPEIPIENVEAEPEEEVDNVIDGSGFGKSVIQKDIDVVLSESMIPYSEHVILERALPRVEDGLKPVQRRILYTLHELDITPEKDYKKSARIVGECLGKFHPHGNTSIYDALVHMAQDWCYNHPLVDGHGNFGSVEGDDAAADRYTEAKLSPITEEILLSDLDKGVVDFIPNFDKNVL